MRKLLALASLLLAVTLVSCQPVSANVTCPQLGSDFFMDNGKCLGIGSGLTSDGTNVKLTPASASVLGGILSSSAPTHQFMNGVDTSGNPLYSTIGTTDLPSTIAVTGDVKAGGHLAGSGSAPAITTCGTGPAAATGSNDNHGKITTGTGAAACTLTWGTRTNAPDCFIRTGATLISPSTNTNTTLTWTASASTAYTYHCLGF